MNSSQWNKDIDNPANKRFVADFKKTYGRLPSLYASQGYDTARLIASAVKAVGGAMSKTDAFREALRRADFASVRGSFKFGPNHHPVQDIYIREVVMEDGVLTNRIVTKAFTDHVDAYVGECKMQ
jgi:branched-chain amino acid transport system substrate-binding protein